MNPWKIVCVLLSGLLVSPSMAAVDFKDGEITTLKNLVEHDKGTGPAAAKLNEKVREKSKVTTASSSMAELTFADSSITRIGANSVFSFQSRERLVKLEQGTVLIHSVPGNGGATVECGGVTASVSGSTFMASRGASGGAIFVLLESSGTLSVRTSGGQSADIRPGQAASTGANPLSPIQVYDVDVGKIMETSPLIQTFKNPLPSQREIDNVSESQQALIREGKIEVLNLEVYAAEIDSGSLKTAEPRERNFDNPFDIETAAGGEGPGGGSGSAANRPNLPSPPTLVNNDPNFFSGNRPGSPSVLSPSVLSLILPDMVTENESRNGIVSLNRPALQDTPVTFVYSYNGETKTKFLTIPAGASTASFEFVVPDDGLIRNGAANAVPVTVTAFAGTLTAQAGIGILDGTTRTYRADAFYSSGSPRIGDGTLGVFILDFPAKLAEAAEAVVTISTAVSGSGTPETRVVRIPVAAGSRDLILNGLNLPDPRIDPGISGILPVTVRVEVPGLPSVEKAVSIEPRSAAAAVAANPALNPVRLMQDFTTTHLGWDPVPGAKGYAIEPVGEIPVFTLMPSYDWFGLLGTAGGTPGNDYRVFGLLNADLTHVGSVASLPGNLFSGLSAPTALAAGSLELTLQGSTQTLLVRDDPVSGFLRLVQTDGSLGPNVGLVDYDSGALVWDDVTPVTDLALTDWSSSFSYWKEAGGLGLDQNPTGPTSDERAALDRYFYFTAKAAGVDGPSSYFAQAPLVLDFSSPTGWIPVTGLLPDPNSDFFAAREKILNPADSNAEFDLAGVSASALYAPRVELAGSLDLVNAAFATPVTVILNAGEGGMDVRNFSADLGGADLTLETSAGAEVVSSQLVGAGAEIGISAKQAVRVEDTVLQAQAAPAQDANGKTSGCYAVVRSGEHVELRNLVLRNFARGEIVSVDEKNRGRVLLSADLARDFNIKELVGAVQRNNQAVTLGKTEVRAPGADLTVEGGLPVAKEIRQINGQAVAIDGESVHLEADRVGVTAGQMAAQARIVALNQITLKAQTLVIDNALLRVVNAAGSINLYSAQGLVNRQYGSIVDGMVNFNGSNTFQIGSDAFTISNSESLLQALTTGKVIENNTGVPVSGAVNIMPNTPGGSLTNGGGS